MSRQKIILPIIILLIMMTVTALGVAQEDIKKEEAKEIVGSTKCKLCHISRYFSWTNTTHYRGFRNSNLPSGFSECESCHGSGAEHVGGDKEGTILVPDSFEKANQACGDECHFNVKKLRKGIKIPMINPQVWKQSNHAQVKVSCVSCHASHKSKDKVNLQSDQFCLDCHNKEGQAGEISKIEEHESGEKCLTCHNPHGESKDINEFDRKYVHFPVSKNECFKCHKPHMAASNKLTTNIGNDLCYDCHSAKKHVYPETAHNEVKGKAGKGLCINCHEPHSADYKPLLKKERTKMCRSCHYKKRAHHFLAIANAEGKATCTDCHDPHGESNEAFLKMKKENICENCHNK